MIIPGEKQTIRGVTGSTFVRYTKDYGFKFPWSPEFSNINVKMFYSDTVIIKICRNNKKLDYSNGNKIHIQFYIQTFLVTSIKMNRIDTMESDYYIRSDL